MKSRFFGFITILSLFGTSAEQTPANEIWFSSVKDAVVKWESNPMWRCFEASEINLNCANYDDGIRVPSISVGQNGYELLFDAHPEDRLNCNETLKEWQNLLVSGEQFCIYSAEVPTSIPEDLTLSYLSAIETSMGRWLLNLAITEIQ